MDNCSLGNKNVKLDFPLIEFRVKCSLVHGHRHVVSGLSPKKPICCRVEIGSYTPTLCTYVIFRSALTYRHTGPFLTKVAVRSCTLHKVIPGSIPIPCYNFMLALFLVVSIPQPTSENGIGYIHVFLSTKVFLNGH